MNRGKLLTKNLTLTPCTPSDCPDFISLEQDVEVMRFLNGGQPVDRAQVSDDGSFLMPDGTEDFVWTARRTDGGAFVGWFCMWPESDNPAEIGYRLRRNEWGKGLATDGARALMKFGFTNRNYDTIRARALVSHEGSRRVLEKIGLKYVRTEQINWANKFPGTEKGDAIYELSRREWIGK